VCKGYHDYIRADFGTEGRKANIRGVRSYAKHESEMAVVDEKLICRLCAEVKEFCVDIFGEDGVKTAYLKKSDYIYQ
jgi:hypothetical protein